jgi:hypothetical protein
VLIEASTKVGFNWIVKVHRGTTQSKMPAVTFLNSPCDYGVLASQNSLQNKEKGDLDVGRKRIIHLVLEWIRPIKKQNEYPTSKIFK